MREPDIRKIVTNATYLGASLQFTLDEFDRFTAKYGFSIEEASIIRGHFEKQYKILEALSGVSLKEVNIKPKEGTP